MNSSKDKIVNAVAWSISVITSIVAVVSWGQGIGWNLSDLVAYQLFPLFGLLAFSLMWAHYIVGALRRLTGIEKAAIEDYLKYTGYLALLFFCLHPAVLWFQLWQDGFGLPPQSYLEHYVAPTLKWAAALGTLSFTFFLAYEFKRWFGQKKWWVIVARGTDLAMLGIIVHGLKLGSHLQSGWFKQVWLFYAVSYVAAQATITYFALTKKPNATNN